MKRVIYQYNVPFNKGTDDAPELVNNLFTKTLPYSDTALEIAKREAYNGEYTIEDDGQPEPDTTTTDDVLNAFLGVIV